MCTQKPPHDYSQQLYDKYKQEIVDYIGSTSCLDVERKNKRINDEHGQSMEKNILSMAEDMYRLRVELANVGKRAMAAFSVANSVPEKRNMYASFGMIYGGGSYPVQYPMHQVQTSWRKRNNLHLCAVKRNNV